MRDCCSYDRYFYKTLLCIVNRFFNRFRDFKCFPHAKAVSSISISYNYNSCKAETTSTFYNFSYTVNGYYTFFKFCFVRIINSSQRNVSLLVYFNSSPDSRAASANAITRPWYTYPPRSKTTCLEPFSTALSANALPTFSAAVTLLPEPLSEPFSFELALTIVMPLSSSISCA